MRRDSLVTLITIDTSERDPSGTEKRPVEGDLEGAFYIGDQANYVATIVSCR